MNKEKISVNETVNEREKSETEESADGAKAVENHGGVENGAKAEFNGKNKKSEISTTKKIAGTGIFAALAFVISLLEFPIFPDASFLKLDFSLVCILLAGFIFGPVSGFAAAGVKELLRFAIGSSTGGVGEIANFIVAASFIAVPTIVYHYKKGFSTVAITIAIGSCLEIAASLLVNRFINFPLYMGDGAAAVFESLWVFVLLFNLIKCVVISVLTILVYKKVSFLVKKI